MNYLKVALKYEAGNHPVVHQCLGQSYIALGMLKVCYEETSTDLHFSCCKIYSDFNVILFIVAFHDHMSSKLFHFNWGC